MYPMHIFFMVFFASSVVIDAQPTIETVKPEVAGGPEESSEEMRISALLVGVLASIMLLGVVGTVGYYYYYVRKKSRAPPPPHAAL